jgi:hypothetical protein
MCDKTRSTHSIMARVVALLDIETAAFAFHGDIGKAKAAAELASIIHDGLVKYSQSVCKEEARQRSELNQQPWVPEDAFDLSH